MAVACPDWPVIEPDGPRDPDLHNSNSHPEVRVDRGADAIGQPIQISRVGCRRIGSWILDIRKLVIDTNPEIRNRKLKLNLGVRRDSKNNPAFAVAKKVL